MTKRMIQRKAHTFATIASFWSAFSALTVLAWSNSARHGNGSNAVPGLIIWSVQFLLVALAAHFRKTETPRETLWFGETIGHATADIDIENVAPLFEKLSAYVPELSTEIERIVATAHQAGAQGEATTTIPITFRGRSEKFVIKFEQPENGLELLISTHLDLADEIDELLASFESATAKS